MTARLSQGDIRHLTELAMMRDKGILTSEEFSRHKTIVLEGRTANDGPGRSRSIASWFAAALAAVTIAGAAIVLSPGESVAHHLTATGSVEQQR